MGNTDFVGEGGLKLIRAMGGAKIRLYGDVPVLFMVLWRNCGRLSYNRRSGTKGEQ